MPVAVGRARRRLPDFENATRPRRSSANTSFRNRLTSRPRLSASAVREGYARAASCRRIRNRSFVRAEAISPGSMRKSTAWSGNRSGCSATRPRNSNAVSILRRISLSVLSFLLEHRFHQRAVLLPVAREILATDVQQIRNRESLQGRQRLRLARAPKPLAMEIAVEVVIPDDLSPTSFDSGRVGDREPGEPGSPSRVLVELEVRIHPILQGEEDLVCLPLGHFIAKWTYDVHIHKRWSTLGEWPSIRPDRPERRYHFDDRATRVILPAALAPS